MLTACVCVCVFLLAVGLGHVDADARAEERQGVHHSRRFPFIPLRDHRPQHEWIFPRETLKEKPHHCENLLKARAHS